MKHKLKIDFESENNFGLVAFLCALTLSIIIIVVAIIIVLIFS